MADEGFNVYLASRPSAGPVTTADMLLMNQGGSLVMVPPSTITNAAPTLVNADSGPAAVQLPASGIARYIKDDNAGELVTFTPQIVGQTIMRSSDPFEWDAVQDEMIAFQLIGSNWYRVG
jgi:hypothetical protein